VAAANRAALDAAVSPGEALVVNIGTGAGTTVNTVWRTIERVTRASVRAYHEPARSGDVRWSVLDTARARTVFGWEAKITLEDGLRRTWEWFATRGASREVA
jgi:UDP-glucose 4-epimerase